MRITRAIALCALLFGLMGLAPRADVFAGVKEKEVRIFLGSYREQDCKPNDVYCLVPVTRTVNGRALALGALKALLAGPTEDEKTRGLYAPYTENLAIRSLRLSRGTARLSLRTSVQGFQRWPGDLAPARFIAAIEQTLKQFPTVRRVVICLDGYEDFASEEDGPKKKCK